LFETTIKLNSQFEPKPHLLIAGRIPQQLKDTLLEEALWDVVDDRWILITGLPIPPTRNELEGLKQKLNGVKAQKKERELELEVLQGVRHPKKGKDEKKGGKGGKLGPKEESAGEGGKTPDDSRWARSWRSRVYAGKGESDALSRSASLPPPIPFRSTSREDRSDAEAFASTEDAMSAATLAMERVARLVEGREAEAGSAEAGRGVREEVEELLRATSTRSAASSMASSASTSPTSSVPRQRRLISELLSARSLLAPGRSSSGRAAGLDAPPPRAYASRMALSSAERAAERQTRISDAREAELRLMAEDGEEEEEEMMASVRRGRRGLAESLRETWRSPEIDDEEEAIEAGADTKDLAEEVKTLTDEVQMLEEEVASGTRARDVIQRAGVSLKEALGGKDGEEAKRGSKWLSKNHCEAEDGHTGYYLLEFPSSTAAVEACKQLNGDACLGVEAHIFTEALLASKPEASAWLRKSLWKSRANPDKADKATPNKMCHKLQSGSSSLSEAAEAAATELYSRYATPDGGLSKEDFAAIAKATHEDANEIWESSWMISEDSDAESVEMKSLIDESTVVKSLIDEGMHKEKQAPQVTQQPSGMALSSFLIWLKGLDTVELRLLLAWGGYDLKLRHVAGGACLTADWRGPHAWAELQALAEHSAQATALSSTLRLELPCLKGDAGSLQAYPSLHGMSLPTLKLRFGLNRALNERLLEALPLINLEWVNRDASLGAKVSRNRHLLMRGTHLNTTLKPN